jgi:riboflavin synthase
LFTGLIEEIGQIKSIRRGSESARINIAAQTVLEGSKIGDSIAVNGVCLTITEAAGDNFSADIMITTLQKTNLAQLVSGDKVNLERALAIGDRLGGHIVSGHIDGQAQIVDKKEADIAVIIKIRPPKELLPYILPQGSVALDGISLTVAEKSDDTFSISLIPHTMISTALINKKKGSFVNIETDIIGKYVESLLADKQDNSKKLDRAFLAEHGFI